jgi:hypothetical protein
MKSRMEIMTGIGIQYLKQGIPRSEEIKVRRHAMDTIKELKSTPC